MEIGLAKKTCYIVCNNKRQRNELGGDGSQQTDTSNGNKYFSQINGKHKENNKPKK